MNLKYEEHIKHWIDSADNDLAAAEIPDEIARIVALFVDNAKTDNINIEKVILFGSYSKGTQNEFSDIDLAVVSNDFEGNRFKDNMKLARSRVRTNINLETHPFRPDDFNENNLFVKEILKQGIQIA